MGEGQGDARRLFNLAASPPPPTSPPPLPSSDKDDAARFSDEEKGNGAGQNHAGDPHKKKKGGKGERKDSKGHERQEEGSGLAGRPPVARATVSCLGERTGHPTCGASGHLLLAPNQDQAPQLRRHQKSNERIRHKLQKQNIGSKADMEDEMTEVVEEKPERNDERAASSLPEKEDDNNILPFVDVARHAVDSLAIPAT
ncbi:hypothetical protein C0Q70_18987 [Pomacea canaliculata]|uniref:Uncharacterized protein n=1 Tax=Pomacea canaliculata TaxID=400727 RepID=A0A2T7NI46_POMCA|nr:hypothetical protein C0Q70_18987 [Pomacea canaliculata]